MVYNPVLAIGNLLFADNICKQFRSRSGLTFCLSLSGSKLFSTLIVFLKEHFEKVNFEKTSQQTTKRLTLKKLFAVTSGPTPNFPGGRLQVRVCVFFTNC